MILLQSHIHRRILIYEYLSITFSLFYIYGDRVTSFYDYSTRTFHQTFPGLVPNQWFCKILYGSNVPNADVPLAGSPMFTAFRSYSRQPHLGIADNFGDRNANEM